MPEPTVTSAKHGIAGSDDVKFGSMCTYGTEE